ncbi:MAG: hypothetical protein ACP5UL_00020 [Thermoplasmata archaeon]
MRLLEKIERMNEGKKKKLLWAVVLVTALMLPAMTIATVVISYEYTLTGSSATAEVYLEQGPNYATAHSMGLTYANQQTSGGIYAVTPIYINGTAGSTYTDLINVYVIYNGTSGLKHAVSVWINVTGTPGLPGGDELYYGTNPLSVSGSTWYNGTSAATGISLSTTGSSSRIGLLTTGTALYIGFYLVPGSGSDTVTIQYNIRG